MGYRCETISMVRTASENSPLLLAELPPTKQQKRLALGIIAALLAAFFAIAPFANIQLSELGAFLPVIQTAIIANDLITSVLLFSQFFVVGQTALLALAIGYVFTGLMMIPFLLTFPGAFSPTGLLGAGLQSAAWIGISYRIGAPLGVIAYALLRNASSTTRLAGCPPWVVIIGSLASVIAIVCGLTWFETAEEQVLPVFFVDSAHGNRSILLFAMVFLSLAGLALGLVWSRRRSVLDLWLMVMCCTWILFQMMSTVIITNRFTVGWYGARCYELIATLVILLALLSETTALYAKLARAVAQERRARDAQLVAMQAMAEARDRQREQELAHASRLSMMGQLTASIAHEVAQPLTAARTYANAGLRWLKADPPNVDEISKAFERIVRNVDRGSAVVARIRALARKAPEKLEAVSLDEVIEDVLAIANSEVTKHGVQVGREFAPDLPPVKADRVQIEQVLLNLVVNAVEAMSEVGDGKRELVVGAEALRSGEVCVSVRDTGPGIVPATIDTIFQPFHTTKEQGLGMGLSICRSIVEAHGGKLWAGANPPRGAVFQFTLPAVESSA
jgi:signal transduction histidine kinase